MCTKKHMCHNEIGLCAQIIEPILGSIANKIGEGLCEHFWRKRIFTCLGLLTLLLKSTPVLELEMTIFVICNLKVGVPICCYLSQLDIYIWVTCGYLWIHDRTPKRHVFKKWLDYVLKWFNHPKPNNQHNWGEPIWPFNAHENLHFDNEQDIHTSSEMYEESGYGLNLDMLTIL